MSKCLVLGANGFIGSHLVDKLLAQGHEVRCFGRYSTSGGRSPQNMPDERPGETIMHGDFLSTASLNEALEGMEYVFHFISTTTPIISDNDPVLDIETNIKMSVELLKLCVKHNVKRVIYASTGGAIYGNQPAGQVLSEQVCPHPLSPYAIGKQAVENYLGFFNKKHGLDYVALRISNPYGPRQNIASGQGVIGIFLDRAIKDQPITIYGDGSMVRDYMYIEDLAHMITACFDKPLQHHLYNLGSGRGSTVMELIDIIEKTTGKQFEKEYKTAPSSFVDNVVLDTTRFESEFGQLSKTELTEGIKLTWEAVRHGKQS